MEWRKSEYMIKGKFGGRHEFVKATGYTCELCEGLTVGITNKMLIRFDIWKPVKFWTMTILPEGLAFKTFKTKKAAQKFIEKDAENLKKYIADCRRRMNNGSVDAAHDEW